MVKVKYKPLSADMKQLLESGTGGNTRVSTGKESQIGEYYYLPVEKLIPYKNQARQSFKEGELLELANTIKEHGIRQALTVIPSPDNLDFYEVISGERRLRAARIAGLSRVPCTILKKEALADEVALIENIQRADLHPVELANAYAKILSRMPYGGLSQLSLKIGKSISSVSETTKLDNLPQEIKEYLIHKNIRSKIIFRKLLKLSNIIEMKSYLGIEKDKKYINMRSILRISLKEDEYIIESNTYRNLSNDQKVKLKQLLATILETL